MFELEANFVALNKSNLDTMVRMSRIAVESLESLTRLNVEAAKALFHEGAANGASVQAIKDWDGFSTWNADLAQLGISRMLGYSRNLYEIAGQTQAEVVELLEQRLLEGNHEAQSLVEEVLKSFRVGNGNMEAAVKLARANAVNVIDGISKAARRAAGLADANIKAAATATAEAVKGTAK